VWVASALHGLTPYDRGQRSRISARNKSTSSYPITVIQEPPPIPKKRPVLVWVISIFYGFSIVSTVASYAVVFSKAIPTTAAQRQYFDSLTIVDHAMTAIIVTLNGVGAVMLFRLKKQAPLFFSCAFGLGLITIAYQCVAKNWFSAVGVGGLIGAAFGWIINIAIITYAWRLRSRHVSS
jgi:hypothetical protein